MINLQCLDTLWNSILWEKKTFAYKAKCTDVELLIDELWSMGKVAKASETVHQLSNIFIENNGTMQFYTWGLMKNRNIKSNLNFICMFHMARYIWKKVLQSIVKK